MPFDPFFRWFFPEYTFDAVEDYVGEVKARAPENGRILDLGCGDNSQLAQLRTERREVWGVDLHEHPRLAHAAWFRRLGPDGGIPFPDAAIDVVAACWVLEHVARPMPFLQEVSRVLRPGGWFVALTPHGWHYATWLIRFVEMLPHRVVQRTVRRFYGRAEHDTFRTFYRLNTPRQLRRAAEPAGMTFECRLGFPNPDYFSFFRPLRCAAIVLDYALEQIRPGMGEIYHVVTLHKPGEGTAGRSQAA